MDHLDFLRADVDILFAELHLDEEKAAIFAARLLTSVNKISTKILWQEPLKLNFIERIGQRYLSAKAIATSKICTQNGFSGKLQYNLMHWATFLSPQSENKGVIESQSSFFVAILTLLGLTWVVSLLPVKGKNIKKSKRKFSLFKKSKKGGDEPFSNCGTMILFGILFILTLMVGMLVFGIILITKGFVFWGLFAMLILPLVL